jgi:hypothetical protein
VIVGDRIAVRPTVLDLATGKTLPYKFSTGCGSYCGTAGALLLGGSLWEIGPRKQEGRAGLRSSCWMNFIPANGMVLMPEGAGGCTCGNTLETSVGWAREFHPGPEFVFPEKHDSRSKTVDFEGSARVEILDRSGKGEIRYTVDALSPDGVPPARTSLPGRESPKLEKPLVFTNGVVVTARTFWPTTADAGGVVSRPVQVVYRLKSRKDTP